MLASSRVSAAVVLVLGAISAASARAAPLPDVAWSTYYGGESNEDAYAVATDGAGNVYISGTTFSMTGIATPGAFQATLGAEAEGFLVKFDSTGKRLWGTYYGGNSTDYTTAMAVDADGFSYVVGGTVSSAGLATPGVHQTAWAGAWDCFVLKFSPTGERLWGTYFGGSDDELCSGLAIDPAGGVALTGYTHSADGIATPDAYRPLIVGYTEGFLARLANDGSLVSATYVGGDGITSFDAVIAAPQGRFVLVGASDTPGLATPGAHQTAPAGMDDGLITVLQGTESLVWSTYYGGSGYDGFTQVLIDGDGDLLLAGTSESTTGIATPGAFRITPAKYDAFVAKFDAGGERLWGTYFGGEGDEYQPRLAATPAGDVLLAGWTESKQGIASLDPFKSYLQGYDGYLAVLTGDGKHRLGSTYFGSAGDDRFVSLALHGPEHALVAGPTWSLSGIGTPGTHQPQFGGGEEDGMLVRFRVAQTPGCVDDDACVSGFCVDGVCCDQACGGGDPGDCLACSKAAGAVQDGVCALAGPAVTCRAAFWVCDVAEACTGVDTTCPEDQFVADMTPCEDGLCNAGSCVSEQETTGETGGTSTSGTTGDASTSSTTGTTGTTGTASTGDTTGDTSTTDGVATTGDASTTELTGSSTGTTAATETGTTGASGESTSTSSGDGSTATTAAPTTGDGSTSSGTATTESSGPGPATGESFDDLDGCACTTGDDGAPTPQAALALGLCLAAVRRRRPARRSTAAGRSR